MDGLDDHPRSQKALRNRLLFFFFLTKLGLYFPHLQEVWRQAAQDLYSFSTKLSVSFCLSIPLFFFFLIVVKKKKTHNINIFKCAFKECQPNTHYCATHLQNCFILRNANSIPIKQQLFTGNHDSILFLKM